MRTPELVLQKSHASFRITFSGGPDRAELERVLDGEVSLDQLPRRVLLTLPAMKVDIRLPGKGNSNSRGARPVY